MVLDRINSHDMIIGIPMFFQRLQKQLTLFRQFLRQQQIVFRKQMYLTNIYPKFLKLHFYLWQFNRIRLPLSTFQIFH